MIENKVWSGEGGNQLENYQAYIDSKYKDYQHKLFIFLTPYTSDELYKNYMRLDYGKVCQAIDNLLNRQTYIMCDKIRYFIEDYKEMVERHIMGNIDNEIFGLCLKIYDEHKEAIDTINKTVDKGFINKVNPILQEAIKEISSLTLKPCANEWIRFVSKKADYDSLKIAKSDWVASDRILMIELCIQRDNIWTDIIIRNPKDDNAKKQRERLLDLAKEVFGYSKESSGYQHIYSVSLFNEEDEYYKSLCSSDSKLKEILKKKLYESGIIETYEEFADKANKLIINIS